MDELKFRRQAYEDPHNQDADFLAQINAKPENQALINELKNLDAKLTNALKVEVADDLADKLILRQQLQQHHKHRRQTGFLVAMAASVAFVVGISFSLLRLGPIDLAEHALAHVYHEGVALQVDQNVNFNQVNAQLASMKDFGNAKFTQQPGKVYYTSYCDFQGVKSLHLVLQGEQSKVTLFIVPLEKRMVLDQTFADGKYQGMGFETPDAFILLIGEDQADLSYVKDEIKNTFI
ncbi:MAG: DUF3379 domain-containing protein [Gammaproteobacteria bacterium]|uniref:DUF3379 domain-containing protein n=1 Tax=Shewanella septentrionalis TaxID=2952223 RepID=A0A9X2WVF8_9GAMM|nr:DUF3379 domain-containing protein [Shewanella septentrionalis]EGT3626456.1 DUF3379 domain-containing protein [Morganella morganii]MBU1391218.1 DUF3379 domain-containing protein [Gammaproteobacteria bacterium]MBU1479338.1 DUF3379 domain-containing protein [Gammaproteobacteria bacterium]MBU2002339.1 DUF3379 domain-containing protein [Gammaproteobacteria bacterium]MBU2132212.1 DUF3379 domain-containing protein [Gammaproteobacteria bacterium]